MLGVKAHQAAQRSSTKVRIMPDDGLPSDPYARAKIAATAILDRFEIAQLDLAFVLGSGWSAAADDLGEPIGNCELADLPGFAEADCCRSWRRTPRGDNADRQDRCRLHRAYPSL